MIKQLRTWVRRFRSDCRGFTVAETVAAVSMVGFLGLLTYQISVLGTRQYHRSAANAEVYRSVRRAVLYLSDDLKVAKQVTRSGSTVTISAEPNGLQRQVEYALQGGELLRTVKDSGGTVLLTESLTEVVTDFTLSVEVDTGLVTYTVRAKTKDPIAKAEPLAVSSQIQMRSAILVF